MQRDPSPGRRDACNSPSEGTRFRKSSQSRPDLLGLSDDTSVIANVVCGITGIKDILEAVIVVFALLSIARNQLNLYSTQSIWAWNDWLVEIQVSAFIFGFSDSDVYLMKISMTSV